MLVKCGLSLGKVLVKCCYSSCHDESTLKSGKRCGQLLVPLWRMLPIGGFYLSVTADRTSMVQLTWLKWELAFEEKSSSQPSGSNVLPSLASHLVTHRTSNLRFGVPVLFISWLEGKFSRNPAWTGHENSNFQDRLQPSTSIQGPDDW